MSGDFKSYREQSRKNWGSSKGDAMTLEQIQTGAILRIADATEAMAKRHTELIDECERLRKNRDYWMETASKWNRERIAQKGVVTKLKKKLAKAQAQAFGGDPAAVALTKGEAP